MPLEGPLGKSGNDSQERISECLVNITDHKFIMVVRGLAKMVKEPQFLVSLIYDE